MSRQWSGKDFQTRTVRSAERFARLGDGAAVDGPASTRKKIWDSRPDTERWLAQSQLGAAEASEDFRIDGLLAKRGTSVWFGAGSTGKTQLMLWMAATIASRVDDRRDQLWLGKRVHGTGHVLVLSAEDTREQIMERLGDVVDHSLKQNEEARRRTLRRVHVMPFLSMTEEEFKHPNPSLLEAGVDKIWSPTGVMDEVRNYIEEWNRTHACADDKIVGVIMDSATSMAGFDSLDAHATTNFFFYLGRLCEALKLFWVVIGHTPKVTSIPPNNWRATATSRLRGVAMWTTAPRMTVEVRLIQEWKTKTGSLKQKENESLRRWLGDRVDAGNILVVYVAKANLKGAYRDERYLVRRPRGAFTDVTELPDELLPALDREKEEADRARAETCKDASSTSEEPRDPTTADAPPRAARRVPGRGRPRQDPAIFIPGTLLVFEAIRGYCTDVGPGDRLSANELVRLIAEHMSEDPNAALVTSASGGGKKPSRPGSINWHLDRLVEAGILEKIGRFYHRVRRSSEAG